MTTKLVKPERVSDKIETSCNACASSVSSDFEGVRLTRPMDAPLPAGWIKIELKKGSSVYVVDICPTCISQKSEQVFLNKYIHEGSEV